jgi:hypothetical protein
VPALRVLTGSTAVVLPSSDDVPSRVAPSWKLTVPVAPDGGPTTAVRTAGSPYITVVGLTLSVVDGPVVAMFTVWDTTVEAEAL